MARRKRVSMIGRIPAHIRVEEAVRLHLCGDVFEVARVIRKLMHERGEKPPQGQLVPKIERVIQQSRDPEKFGWIMAYIQLGDDGYYQTLKPDSENWNQVTRAQFIGGQASRLGYSQTVARNTRAQLSMVINHKEDDIQFKTLYMQLDAAIALVQGLIDQAVTYTKKVA